ncbi:MAG: glycosidase, partial [Acidobacteriota bacterium]
MTGIVSVNDTGIAITPDRARVITKFFVPGLEDTGPGDSRATPVVERILALDTVAVTEAMSDIEARFAGRHRDLHATFIRHAEMIASRLPDGRKISPERLLFLGASFTHEFAIEAAALCNPSIVLLSDDDHGDASFVLSVRGIGEGHRSSIGFRTGTVTRAGLVTIDKPGRLPQASIPTPGENHRSVFKAKLSDRRDDHENAIDVLDLLPPIFTDAELDERIEELAGQEATRRHTARTIANLRDLAKSSYRIEFPAHTDISERVLWPHAPAESHGMEDARFVRFADDDGSISYYATYTAFDGTHISQQLLHTTDFATFTVSSMAGAAAVGKGLALFPRKIRGRYAALSRADRESNSIAFSDDIRCWPTSQTIQVPEQSWEILQLGNCGSPIETDRGWLV